MENFEKIRSKRAGRIIAFLLIVLIIFYIIHSILLINLLNQPNLNSSTIYNLFYSDKSAREIFLRTIKNLLLVFNLSILGYYLAKASRLAYLTLLTWMCIILGTELIEYFVFDIKDINLFIRLFIASIVVMALLQKDLREIYLKK